MEMMRVGTSSFTHSGLASSFRFQTLFTITAGIVLPCILVVLYFSLIGRVGGLHSFVSSQSAMHSVVAATVGALALLTSLRRMELYPGVAINRHILPGLTVIYGVILAVLMVFRFEYSSTVLIACFLGTLVARYAIAALGRRAPNQTFLLVPGGRVANMGWLLNLPLQRLRAPVLPERKRQVALIADLHHDHAPEWERFLAEAAIGGTPVYHFKQVWEATSGKVQIEHLSENHFGALIPSLAYRKVKRLVDVVVSILALPILVPFLAGVAICIRLDSPGPVLFRQRRMGYRGKVFDVIKFRTMSVAANGEDAAVSITKPGDQRITRIGHFLRRTRIDELPQVLNILRGEMSWIGPRPEAVSLSMEYEREIPFYRYRHIVRPGITGWAQVNQGHVTAIGEIDEKLQYDFYYVKNFSYWIDLLIFFRTIKVILTGFGAK